MQNLLSASSLMLAALALVYSQWYPQILATVERGKKAKQSNPADRDNEIEEVGQMLRTRAIPLVLATLLFVLVLLPDALSIIVYSAGQYGEEGLQEFRDYSAISTMFVLIVLLSGAFWVHLLKTALEMHELKNDLKTDPN